MASLRDIAAQAQREARLPSVAGERCVHSLMEVASCRACLDACPRDAWTLDDERLGIDTEACDGCGLCVPVCPEGAIETPIKALMRNWGQESIALVACERSGCASTEGVVPCVHALGLSDLLRMYNAGVRRLFYSCSDCDDCSRGTTTRLQKRVGDLDRALRQGRLAGMELIRLPVADWSAVLEGTTEADGTPRVNRRGFFRNMATTGLEAGMKRAGVMEQPTDVAVPPGRLMPGGDGVRIPLLPRIDAQRCNGCDACVRLCPHGALLFDDTAASVRYETRPENCSGCRICVDLCEQEAITLLRWQPRTPQRIPLMTACCKRCGVPFHVPVNGGECTAPERCRICARQGHQNRLFQVLD